MSRPRFRLQNCRRRRYHNFESALSSAAAAAALVIPPCCRSSRAEHVNGGGGGIVVADRGNKLKQQSVGSETSKRTDDCVTTDFPPLLLLLLLLLLIFSLPLIPSHCRSAERENRLGDSEESHFLITTDPARDTLCASSSQRPQLSLSLSLYSNRPRPSSFPPESPDSIDGHKKAAAAQRNK